MSESAHPKFPHLFSPLKLRNVTLKNRVAVSAHFAGWWVDGGLPSDVLASPPAVSITAVDDTTLYYTDTSAATIYAIPKVPTDAGAPKVFATLQNVPGDMVATEGAVYWANADGIVSCPASGCPDGPDKPRVIVAEKGITDFAITSSCFFYANPQSGAIKATGR